MSSAGMSGTSNTERGNPLNGQNIPGSTPDDTAEVIEIIEIEEPMLMSDEALAAEQDALDRALTGTGFRWWYIPAVGLPVVVGTGAAVWYLTKGPQSFQDAYDIITRRDRTSRRKRMIRRGMRIARKSAKSLPAQTEDLRERLVDTWDDARDSVLEWWDTMTDRDTLEQIRGRANDAADAAKDQLAKAAAGLAAASATVAAKQKASELASTARARSTGAGARAQGKARDLQGTFDVGQWLTGLSAVGGTWLAKNQAQDLKNRAKGTASDLRDKARSQLRQAQVKGTLVGIGGKGAVSAAKVGAPVAAKAVVTKAKTERAAKKTGRKVNRAWKDTRAFTFGMLVTATLTYIRMWQSRLNEKNLRETAGGRLVRDA